MPAAPAGDDELEDLLSVLAAVNGGGEQPAASQQKSGARGRAGAVGRRAEEEAAEKLEVLQVWVCVIAHTHMYLLVWPQLWVHMCMRAAAQCSHMFHTRGEAGGVAGVCATVPYIIHHAHLGAAVYIHVCMLCRRGAEEEAAEKLEVRQVGACVFIYRYDCAQLCTCSWHAQLCGREV